MFQSDHDGYHRFHIVKCVAHLECVPAPTFGVYLASRGYLNLFIGALIACGELGSHLGTSTLLHCGLKSNQIYLDPKSQCLPRRTFHPAVYERKPFSSFVIFVLILMPLVDKSSSALSLPSLSLDSPTSSWKIEKEDGEPQRKRPAAKNT